MGFPQDLHKFITGSENVGEYPNPQWMQWERTRQACSVECQRVKAEVPKVGTNSAGTATKVGGHYSDVVAQITDRWQCGDGVYRSVQEQIDQVRACTNALIRATPAPDTPAPSTPPSTGGGQRPKAEYLDSLQSANDVVSGGMKVTKHNREAGGGQIGKSGPPWPPPVVSAPGGGKAIQFRLPSNGKRIEIEPNHRRFPGSGQWFFGVSMFFDQDFPLGGNSWQVVWQLHGNDVISPRFSLQARNNEFRAGDSQSYDVKLVKGRWYNVVLRCNFGDGNMQLWVDGKDCGTKQVGKSKPEYYLKCGFYHDPKLPGGTIYQRNYALGQSYEQVDPSTR